MYSVNFNEEEKKKKRKAGDSAFADTGGNAFETGGVPFLQGENENVTQPAAFDAGGFGNDAVFGKTRYASSLGDGARDKEAQQGFTDVDVTAAKPGVAAVSPFTLARGAGDDKPKNYMSPKNLRDAGRNKGGIWEYAYGRAFPQQTPERAATIYSVSPQAIDNVATDYFKEDMSQIYDKELDDARKRANKAFADYSADPVAAMRISREEADPVKAADKALAQVDMQKLRSMVEPLALRGGFDVDMYIEDYVKPTLRNKMIDDYIEKEKPKNSAEYILRSGYNNSLVGKMNNIGMGNKPFAHIENEALSRYDAKGWENFAANVGSLLIDAPAFAAFGAMSGALVGKATNVVTNRLAGRVFAYKAAEGMSKQRAAAIAERLVTQNLANRIAQGAATQGLTLGTYDFANSIAEDVLYNDSVDFGKAFGSFGKGALTGGAAGAVGTGLKWFSRGLTGGRKLAASTGVLSAESAVFTLSTQLDKLAHDVDIEPIDILRDYGESMATLGIMKMTHWRPKGVTNKLKSDGTLKDELRLSESEKAEMREMNVDPGEFMSQVQSALKMPSYGIGSTREGITQRYLQMMQSKELSAATKAKLMYIIENKLTSTPPVPFDYDVEKTRSGKWRFTTYDFEGNRVESRLFDDPGRLKSHMLVEKSKLRDNRIAAYERELLQGFDSQNLLRQAGLYAKEKRVGIDDISQALYKRAQKAPLSGWEEMLVRDIVERTTYDRNGMVQYLADMRRTVEKKHGLEEGSLLVDIRKPFYSRSNAANSALDEYEALVRHEVNSLKDGTDKERAAQFRELGEQSAYKGMTNEQVRAKEIEDYYTAHPDEADAVGSGMASKPIKIDDSEPSPYVWSYNGTRNSVEDLENYEQSARELAKRYNFEVQFVNNEREIPVPNEADKYGVQDYNNKLRSMGWIDREGKVTINLPNISSMEDLERTVVHECVAHGGLSKLFGNHFSSFLEEVYRRSAGDVRVGIANKKGEYPFVDNHTLIEEYLAHLTEKSVLSRGERSLLTGFKDFVKNALVRLNIYTGRNRRVTESDLMNLLRQHAKYVERRKAPSDYRRWVFGHFDAAKQNRDTYYDREAYEREMREKIAGGRYFMGTPAGLYDEKVLRNYELLPEEQKQEALRRWNATDEEVMELKAKERFRFENGKANGDHEFDYGDIDLTRAAQLEQRGIGTLSELLHNPSFYAAYPELANLPVKVVAGSYVPLRYDSRAKQLLLDRNFFSSPENRVYLNSAMQDVVRDYESFGKAVSNNVFGINSRLGQKYSEAQKVIESIENARRANPDFDANRDIDKAFAREYGFSPAEFAKRFPSLDDYMIYRLTGKDVAFSDDAEVRKAMGGGAADEASPAGQSAVKTLDDLKGYFNGPLDIIYRKLRQMQSDDPLQFEQIRERVRGAGLSPDERSRFEHEMEEYAKEALQRMRQDGARKADFGYEEYRKREDEKKRRRNNEIELRRWRDRFPFLDEDPDGLN